LLAKDSVNQPTAFELDLIDEFKIKLKSEADEKRLKKPTIGLEFLSDEVP
jgi:hypothetical protein